MVNVTNLTNLESPRRQASGHARVNLDEVNYGGKTFWMWAAPFPELSSWTLNKKEKLVE